MIIYGWKQYVLVMAVLRLMCSQCGMSCEHVLRRLTTKFTLFWIPLFPIGRKYTLFCTACGSEQKLPKEQAVQLAAAAPAEPQPAQPAFGPPAAGLAMQPGHAPQPALGPPPGPQPAFGPPSGPPPGFGPQPAYPPGPRPGPAFGPAQPAPGYGPPNSRPPGFGPQQPYPPQGYPPR